MAFRISVAFLAGVLALLAVSLYLSERYVDKERRLFIAGDLRGALEAVQTASRLDPFDSEPLQGEAYILEQQGRNEEAVSALRDATEREPNNYLPYLLMAGLQSEELRDPKAAEESYRESLALNPKATTARTSLAALLLRQGKLEEAGREYQILEEQKQISYEGLYDLGRIYVRTGKPEKGFQAISSARRKASEDLEEMSGVLRAQRTEYVESMDLALADALVVQGEYARAGRILLASSSEQAPALLQLLDTDPAAYREQVLNSDVY